MADLEATMQPSRHSHVFLGEHHRSAETRTWAVIWLCGAMMALEIVGGLLFGSIALVADGLHMSTHAGALLLAAGAFNLTLWVFGAVLAELFLGEQFHLFHAIGIALIAAGIVLASLRPRRA